jgi:uncharacterized membrane protein SpoIIM required for sporulation
LFFGIFLAFVLWSSILPFDRSVDYFSSQIKILEGVNSDRPEQISAKAFSPGENLSIILNNNFKVLFMSLAVSLIYGAGAILVLTWNASVLGFVIGSGLRNYGIFNSPAVFAKYLLHGIPEMMAYFIAILVGGMIYSLFIAGEFRRNICFSRVFINMFLLILSAGVILLLAGLLEVYISPLI